MKLIYDPTITNIDDYLSDKDTYSESVMYTNDPIRVLEFIKKSDVLYTSNIACVYAVRAYVKKGYIASKDLVIADQLNEMEYTVDKEGNYTKDYQYYIETIENAARHILEY